MFFVSFQYEDRTNESKIVHLKFAKSKPKFAKSKVFRFLLYFDILGNAFLHFSLSDL